MDCVVLAGGINRRDLFPGYEPGYKALVEIAGRPLLSYVLEALHGSDRVDRLAIVGDEEALKPVAGDLRYLSPGNSLVDSIKSALGAFPEQKRVLICTADLPLVRAEMVDQFLGNCQGGRPGYGDHLLLCVVPSEKFQGVYARCEKNFNGFRDVRICHGNLAVVSPGILTNQEAMSRIDQIYAARTSPIRSALAIGPALGLAYVFGVHLLPLLRLDRFAAMLSRRFGIGMSAVTSPYPQVAVDIDEPADYLIATEVLSIDS